MADSRPVEGELQPAPGSLPVALIRFDELGEMQLGIFGEGVRLVVIDERSPHDRVYEVTHREPLKALDRLIARDEPIGHANEARHEAMVARMTALFAGRPHLASVPDCGAAIQSERSGPGQGGEAA